MPRPKLPDITKTCPICNSQFTVPGNKAKKETCSLECSKALRVGRMSHTKAHVADIQKRDCEVCGQSFEVDMNTRNGAKKRTCSRACQGKTERVRMSGDDHHMKRQDVKDKVRDTTIDRHGGVGFQVKDFAKASRDTMINRYGVEHAHQSEESRSKFTRTMIERYGVEHAAQNENIKKKTNVKWFESTDRFYRDVRTNDWWIANREKYPTLEEMAEAYSTTPNHLCRMAALVGFKLDNNRATSRHERKLADALREFAQVETSTKSLIPPKEIDIYIPEYNIAIEIDGIYWHSEIAGGKSRDYHAEKTRLCKEKGIRLLHFWDIELEKNFDLCLSMIKTRIGLNEKVYARKLNVVEIDAKQARVFHEVNHLAGFRGGKHLALVDSDGIVNACLTYASSRYRDNSTEVIRYSTLSGKTVVGGFSKLCARIPGNDDLISYADMRYSTGNVYAKSGFVLESTGKPSPWYTQNYDELRHRSILWGMGGNGKTQWESAKESGWDRVWDCGQQTWKKAR